MFTESGTLPLGIHLPGEDCRAYSLRPMKVKDAIEVQRGGDASRCAEDDELMALALLGRRLRIDGIPPESMTLDFMLNLFDEDLAEIMSAEGRLKKQIARFRGQDAPPADTGAAAPGAAVGDRPGDGPGGGAPVAGGLVGDLPGEKADEA